MIWVCACTLLRYRIKRCVADVVYGSKMATNHLLQWCVAVAGLFFLMSKSLPIALFGFVE